MTEGVNDMRKVHTWCRTTSAVQNSFKMCTIRDTLGIETVLIAKTCVSKILYCREIQLQNI